MFKQSFSILIVALVTLSCASKYKTLKEIDKDAPHQGHLFRMDQVVIEVAEVPTKRMKFYFYNINDRLEPVPIPVKGIELKNGILDPESSKQNFGIQFIERQTYIEGILEKFKLDDKVNHEVTVDVKINGKKRSINIPIENH